MARHPILGGIQEPSADCRRCKTDHGTVDREVPWRRSGVLFANRCRGIDCSSREMPDISFHPTGAKGLNLAASDVHYLSTAFIDYYKNNDEAGLDNYSARALARVWKAERFSWSMTRLLNNFPDNSEFEERMRQAEFDYLSSSRAAQK